MSIYDNRIAFEIRGVPITEGQISVMPWGAGLFITQLVASPSQVAFFAYIRISIASSQILRYPVLSNSPITFLRTPFPQIMSMMLALSIAAKACTHFIMAMNTSLVESLAIATTYLICFSYILYTWLPRENILLRVFLLPEEKAGRSFWEKVHYQLSLIAAFSSLSLSAIYSALECLAFVSLLFDVSSRKSQNLEGFNGFFAENHTLLMNNKDFFRSAAYFSAAASTMLIPQRIRAPENRAEHHPQ